jgi:hypothetical protein
MIKSRSSFTLCARRESTPEAELSSSVERVTSKNSALERRSANERETLDSKSFHVRENFSDDPIFGCLQEGYKIGQLGII